MKTATAIIKYLEMELADANFMHDEMNGADAQRALAYLIKAHTIAQLLDGIKSEITKEEEIDNDNKQYIITLCDMYVKGMISREDLEEKLNK